MNRTTNYKNIINAYRCLREKYKFSTKDQFKLFNNAIKN